MSRKILEYCMALFFVALTIVVILGAFNMTRVSGAVLGLIDESSRFVAESRKMVENTQKAQNDLYESSQSLQEVIGEAGIALLAGVMAEQGLMPRKEADSMISESLAKIEKRSPRLGRLATVINKKRMDTYGGHTQ